tara:strand:- start:157 stop:390 length:234 start_codon:yes stop_codon:yes gene_type:complete
MKEWQKEELITRSKNILQVNRDKTPMIKGINLWSVEQESKKSKLRLVGLTDARLIELVIEELTSAEEIPSFISICKL